MFCCGEMDGMNRQTACKPNGHSVIVYMCACR